MTKKSNGRKLSITVDEWTNINMKRFVNVTLHDGNDSFKSGLCNVKPGSCKSECTTNLVEEKLDTFGLNFVDIVGSTHDGCNAMKKYGRIIPAESQLSYNHAIHLAVTDVFYPKAKRKNAGEISNQ